MRIRRERRVKKKEPRTPILALLSCASNIKKVAKKQGFIGMWRLKKLYTLLQNNY